MTLLVSVPTVAAPCPADLGRSTMDVVVVDTIDRAGMDSM